MWRCLNVERSNKGPTNPQVDIFSLSGKGDEMRSARSPPFLYRISIHTTSVYNLHFEACFCLGILRAVLRGRGTVEEPFVTLLLRLRLIQFLQETHAKRNDM